MAGLTGLEAAAAEIRARQAAYGENRVTFAKFDPGVPTVVRFLEQGDDVAWAYVHEAPKPNPTAVAKVTPCLNQDDHSPQACPGCEQGNPRKIKGWINLIYRNAPVYKKDQNDKDIVDQLSKQKIMVGQADQVQVWNSGPNLFTTLGQKDRTWKGLMSRDFVVIRTGSGLDTKYAIEPAEADGGPQKMSENDLKLFGEKTDLNRFIQPEDYDYTRQFLMGVPREQIVASRAAQTSPVVDEDYFANALAAKREAE